MLSLLCLSSHPLISCLLEEGDGDQSKAGFVIKPVNKRE